MNIPRIIDKTPITKVGENESLFALSIAASVEIAKGTRHDHTTGVCYAVSEAEALGKSILLCQATYPLEHGYYGHSAKIFAIPQLTIDSFATHTHLVDTDTGRIQCTEPNRSTVPQEDELDNWIEEKAKSGVLSTEE